MLLRLRQQLGKLDLLILDELGYVPASKAGAELLFDVIATAYERNSLVVTTNLPFENCQSLCCSATRLSCKSARSYDQRRSTAGTG